MVIDIALHAVLDVEHSISNAAIGGAFLIMRSRKATAGTAVYDGMHEAE